MEHERRRDMPELLERIHKIENALNSVEAQMGRIISDIESEKGTRTRTNDRLYKHIDDMNHFIFGNGSVGLTTRLDRLERIEENRRWSLRLAWTSIIGIFSKVFYDSVLHK